MVGQMVDVDTSPSRTVKGSASLGLGLIALLFVLTLGLQLMRSMVVDFNSQSGTRVDLVGYALCQFLGLRLAVYSLQRGRLRPIAVYLCMVLVLYLAVIFILTAPENSSTAFLVSRFGILNWLLIGLGTAGAIDALVSTRRTGNERTIRILYSITASIVAALAVSISLPYLASPVPTLNYQAVANNAILLMIVNLVVIEALWGREKPSSVVVGFSITGLLLTLAAAMAGSTAIVAFWGGATVVLFFDTLRQARIHRKLMVILPMGGLGAVFVTTEMFDSFATDSRVSVFFENRDAFAPINSRLSILDNFGQQFAVSPIFGNFQAEIITGAGGGNYVHSLPLSFLTHSGVVGFLFVSIILLLVLGPRLVRRRIETAERQYAAYMLVVLLLGTLANFLTWSVFWFMLGLLCKRCGDSSD